MSFVEIKHRPELVFSKICDGHCVYANVAATACRLSSSQETAGMTAVADRLFNMLDPLYAGTIAPEGIIRTIGELFPEESANEHAIRGMFRYALDVDMLAEGRLAELSEDRRRQFVQMTCDLAQQGLYPASIWTDHFLASQVAAE